MVPKVGSEPTTPKSALQDGVDSLWKFQLRKENAALLEKQEANTKLLQSLATESIKNKKDYEERMAALETTVLNLQSDERNDRHAFEKWSEELATLKAQMGGVLNTLDKHDQQFSEVHVAAPGRGRSSFRSELEDLPDIPITTARTNGMTTSATNQQAPITPRTSSYFPAQMRAPDTNVGLHTPNRNVETTSAFPGPMTRSRSRSRTRSQSVEALAPTLPQPQVQVPVPAARTKATATAPAPTPPTPAAQPAKLPRLYQGAGPLKAYLDKATARYDSYPGIKDKTFEIEFVASFIKGIRDDDNREILVAELQQHHQSRTKKDGKVEILCKWKDVDEGLKSAEMIKVGDAKVGPKEKGGKEKESHKSKFLKELKNLET